jgi:hypothetical protein
MGYWTNTMERFGIKDRTQHPWAELLKQTLAQVEPATLAELEADGELGAFLSVKVDECMKSIRDMQQGGMEYETAKELAFESMLPREPETVEDWELEGAQQEEADAFSDWIESNGQGKSAMED